MQELLDELEFCVRTHDADARILGNLRAGDIAELLTFLREKWDERDAAVNEVLDHGAALRDLRGECGMLRKTLRLLWDEATDPVRVVDDTLMLSTPCREQVAGVLFIKLEHDPHYDPPCSACGHVETDHPRGGPCGATMEDGIRCGCGGP